MIFHSHNFVFGFLNTRLISFPFLEYGGSWFLIFGASYLLDSRPKIDQDFSFFGVIPGAINHTLFCTGRLTAHVVWIIFLGIFIADILGVGYCGCSSPLVVPFFQEQFPYSLVIFQYLSKNLHILSLLYIFVWIYQ